MSKRHTFKRNELIDNVIDMRLNKGWTIPSIFNFLKSELNYSQPYAYQIIRDARTEIEERSLQLFGESIKEDIERFESLYENAMLNKNTKEARENLKEISKLKGHYIERIELKGDLTHNIPEIIKLIEVKNENTNNGESKIL